MWLPVFIFVVVAGTIFGGYFAVTSDGTDFLVVWAEGDEPFRAVNGATVTITNPGTIGTMHSVPRLMPCRRTIRCARRPIPC